MRAYLVQHGEAHPEEVSPERELTPRGRSDVERVAALLANGGVRVAKVYHSGKTRARARLQNCLPRASLRRYLRSARRHQSQ